jgi:hypothetical protein
MAAQPIGSLPLDRLRPPPPPAGLHAHLLCAAPLAPQQRHPPPLQATAARRALPVPPHAAPARLTRPLVSRSTPAPLARRIHPRRCPPPSLLVANALVDLYAKCEDLPAAHAELADIPLPDAVSLNSLLDPRTRPPRFCARRGVPVHLHAKQDQGLLERYGGRLRQCR